MSAEERLRILLVDDEKDIVAVLSKGLVPHGFTVDSFNDPEEALSKFKPDYYDAIILDIRMPKMNGFELARAIWKQDSKAEICFLTAFEIYKPEAERVLPTMKSHCFIKKPILASDLANHIRTNISYV
jgi:DNA-binding response OmpR family regulator